MSQLIAIPGYRIEREIGSGAMAKVYLAIHENLERQVALKVMSTDLQGDKTFCDRFIKEARIMGRLVHPYIITVYDSGSYAHQYYLAMEYIPNGTTLKERIRNGLPIQQALNFLKPIASALGFAHQQGFVHRDVKPANVLIRPDGTPLLADFGIAKSFSADATQMTQAGWTVGTPNYMSPEQALGGQLDARSDLYSLGVMFYEMLTGSKPYSSPIEHIQSPLPQLPMPLRPYQPLIDRLMAKRPDDRFSSAEELIAAIDALLVRGPQDSEATQLSAPSESTVISKPTTVRESNTRLMSSTRSGPRTATQPDLENSEAGAYTQVMANVAQKRIARSRYGLVLAGVGALGVGVAVMSYPALWQEALRGLSSEVTSPPQIPGGTPSLRELAVVAPERPTTPGPEVRATPSPQTNPVLGSPTTNDQSRIRRLLIIANVHRDTGFLTDPPGSNALEAYEQILAIDPNNEEALRGLDEIAYHFYTLALEARQNGEPLTTVMSYVREGLRVRPRHRELLTLLGRGQAQ